MNNNIKEKCEENSLFSGLVGLNQLSKQEGKCLFSSLSVYITDKLNKQPQTKTQTNLPDYLLAVKREKLLQDLRQKQSFRVAIGKSKWIDYETFNPDYNLREILDDEIVIEFDCEPEISYKATMLTLLNITLQGIIWEVWEHGGRSPHIHIRDLPIKHLDLEKRRTFKKVFIRNVVPLEYLQYVDYSLTGVHLVRLEWSNCFKNKYGVKKLLHIYDPINDLILKKNLEEFEDD
mgnify:CR=1 FL=1